MTWNTDLNIDLVLNKNMKVAVSSNSVYMVKMHSSKGDYLADPKGRTLYSYDKDVNGVSDCYGFCAISWPVYKAPSSSNLPSNISVTKRKDNSLQYCYKGKPLYYFIIDVRPGVVLGDGAEGIWHIVKP